MIDLFKLVLSFLKIYLELKKERNERELNEKTLNEALAKAVNLHRRHVAVDSSSAQAVDAAHDNFLSTHQKEEKKGP